MGMLDILTFFRYTNFPYYEYCGACLILAHLLNDSSFFKLTLSLTIILLAMNVWKKHRNRCIISCLIIVLFSWSSIFNKKANINLLLILGGKEKVILCIPQAVSWCAQQVGAYITGECTEETLSTVSNVEHFFQSGDTVVGCFVGHPTEFIVALINEIAQMISIVTECKLYLSLSS